MDEQYKLNEFYIKLNSIKNMLEVLQQSMAYCMENNITTYNNAELVEEIKQKVYHLLEETDNSLTEKN